MKIIGKYKNGNYDVIIFDDGTKVRYTDDNFLQADFPESCDVKITDKCSQGCSFCYEGCTKEGSHANLMLDENTPAQKWIETLHPFTEIALNGNDLDVPGFDWFLKYLYNKNVFACVTVNQNQFIQNFNYLYDLYNKKLIRAIGVSVSKPDLNIISYIKKIPNTVIHTIAGVIDEEYINALKNQDLKILILGYKKVGRGSNFYLKNNVEIDTKIKWLKDKLNEVSKYFKVISFDNLAIEQLGVRKMFDKEEDWNKFFMGVDGSATFYIDAVKQQYSRNSCASRNERYDSKNKTIKEMFTKIKR